MLIVFRDHAEFKRRRTVLIGVRSAHNLSLREAGELDAIKRGFKAWRQWRKKRGRQ